MSARTPTVTHMRRRRNYDCPICYRERNDGRMVVRDFGRQLRCTSCGFTATREDLERVAGTVTSEAAATTAPTEQPTETKGLWKKLTGRFTS